MNSERPVTAATDLQRIRALVATAEQQAARAGSTASSTSRVPPSLADADGAPLGSIEALLARDLQGYRLLAEVHRGGQGLIFRALQLSTRRQVALKVLRGGPFASALERARFEREVHVLAQLQHADIVAIHDSGQAAGYFYLVTDFVEGRPLDAYVAAAGRPVRPTLQLFARICDAVHAAHLRGVVHRDLKPGNILVDADGAPRVLDFGLAKLSDAVPAAGAADTLHPGSSETAQASAVTLAGQFIGSLPWCSPEQASGAPVDIRTDVYSLGVTLYQALTGRFPYDVTGEVPTVLAVVRAQEPLSPRSARPDLDDEVETILLKCLQKAPARRYQSAGELARDVRHYLIGAPIEAKRDHALYVIRKALRRHWLVTSAAATLLALVAIALPVFITLWQAAGRERDRAVAAEDEQRRQRQIAEGEASKAQAVTRFLGDMLGSADPLVAQGRDITVRDVLTAAQRQVDAGSFAEEPDVEAAVRATLGQTYLAISRDTDAAAQLEAAVALLTEHHGPAHPDLVDPLVNLARVRRGQGAFAESAVLAQRALAIAEATYGPQDAASAPALAALAFTLLEQGQAEKAVALLRRRLEILRTTLGSDHPDVALATTDLAQAIHDPATSEQLLLDASTHIQHSLAPNHPQFVRVFRAQGQIQLMRRDYSAAAASFQEALRRARAIFGNESNEVYTLLADLAMLHEFAGDTQQQIQTLDESLRIARVLFGEDSLELARRKFDLCIAQKRAGCEDEAEQEGREALDLLRQAGEPDRRLGAVLRYTLATFALRRQDWDVAEALALEVLSVKEEELAPYPWPRAAARGVLGAVHAARGEYEAGEALLLEACNSLGRGAFVRQHRQAAIEQLVALYEAWGDAEAAQRWRSELAHGR